MDHKRLLCPAFIRDEILLWHCGMVRLVSCQDGNVTVEQGQFAKASTSSGRATQKLHHGRCFPKQKMANLVRFENFNSFTVGAVK